MSSSPSLTPPAGPPRAYDDRRFHSSGAPGEWEEYYYPGSYHPVHLGDVLNERYEVIRKLGYGSYATIWLAVDNETSRYVAVKIVIAKSTDKSKEPDVIDTISLHARDDPNAAKYIVKFLDSFTVNGPNGTHMCFVMEPMGSSVIKVIDRVFPGPRHLSVEKTKSILRQILTALCFLHEHGIVHGDLQLGNFLYTIRDIDSVPVSQLQQNETNTRIDYLRRKDGKVDKWAPRYLVRDDPLDEKIVSMSDDEVKLADFGEAFKVDDPPETIHTPSSLRAPEWLLGFRPTTAVDIWNLGCLLFVILTGGSMVDLCSFSYSSEVEDDEHLIQLIEILGPLPAHMYAKWSRAQLYFDENGVQGPEVANPLDGGLKVGTGDKKSEEPEEDPSDSPMPRPNLRDMFHKIKPESISDEEEEEIIKLLRLMLRYDPSERPTARELLEHPWIRT